VYKYIYNISIIYRNCCRQVGQSVTSLTASWFVCKLSSKHHILSGCNNNNNNNNNHDDIYSAAIYGASHMREFTVVPLGQSRSVPGGRQLLGQAANLTFESTCRLL